MSEEKIREIANAANLVVDGYAMLQDGARVKVVHLYTGRVVVVDERLLVVFHRLLRH